MSDLNGCSWVLPSLAEGGGTVTVGAALVKMTHVRRHLATALFRGSGRCFGRTGEAEQDAVFLKAVPLAEAQRTLRHGNQRLAQPLRLAPEGRDGAVGRRDIGATDDGQGRRLDGAHPARPLAYLVQHVRRDRHARVTLQAG